MMEDDRFVDLLGGGQAGSFDLNIFESGSQSKGHERAKEIAEQNLTLLIDECFWNFPNFDKDKVQKSLQKITEVLEVHRINDDLSFQNIIQQGLSDIVRGYPWESEITKA